MDFIRGQNTLYFLRDFDFRNQYDFGPVKCKLPGISKNGPLVCYSAFTETGTIQTLKTNQMAEPKQ